jgi:hypothetical protein
MAKQHDYITLSESLGDRIAAIPALFSFRPANSIVLIGFTHERMPTIAKVVVRCDLPASKQIQDTVHQLLTYAVNSDLDIVELLIVAHSSADFPELPHRDLVDQLTQLLQGSEIAVSNAVWVDRIECGVRWRSYTDATSSGLIGDPARLAVGNHAIHAGREDFVAQLAPDPKTVLDHRSRLLRAMPPVHPYHDLALLQATVARIEADGTEPLALEDEILVQFGHALTHPHVLDICLEWPLTERAEASERLWELLTRALPRSIVAPPACLLTASIYLRGDPLATEALEIALAADPDCRVAKAFRKLIYSGVPPEKFREILTEAVFTGARGTRGGTTISEITYSPSEFRM